MILKSSPCICQALRDANEDAARLAAIVKGLEFLDEDVFCPDCHAFLEDPHTPGCEIKSALDIHAERVGTVKVVVSDAVPAGTVLFISPGPLFDSQGQIIEENAKRLCASLINLEEPKNA